MTVGPVQEIQVGALTATVLQLGEISDDLSSWFKADIVTVPDGLSRLPINCLHVSGSGISILIDACDPGLYPDVKQTGISIIQSLEIAGIAPESITHVILTHGHHDHFCGVATPSKEPVFRSARHILAPQDWGKGTLTPEAQMADGKTADPSPLEMLFQRGLLDLGKSTFTLPPQINLIEAPGETKGHRVVRLSSDGDVLYFLADLFHLQAEIDNPKLCPLWTDMTALIESRNHIVTAMRRDNARFLCSHISTLFSASVFAEHQ
ncbi:MAG: hypothetical protein CMP83_10920 [Gammaproteobacteria bacterium]|nr:hypothetical protein [Gammaproteobacteria bacterium]